jgi:hypothetical protein
MRIPSTPTANSAMWTIASCASMPPKQQYTGAGSSYRRKAGS